MRQNDGPQLLTHPPRPYDAAKTCEILHPAADEATGDFGLSDSSFVFTRLWPRNGESECFERIFSRPTDCATLLVE